MNLTYDVYIRFFIITKPTDKSKAETHPLKSIKYPFLITENDWKM